METSTADTYALTDEQVEFRDAIRQIVAERVAPRAAEIDAKAEYPWDIRRLFAEHDLLGLPFATEHGGTGTGTLMLNVAVEEVAKACASSALILMIQELGTLPIQLFGTDELKGRFLPRCASGEWSPAFALSEPEAGSDPASMRTRAKRDGPDWVLDGTKMWITNGGIADLAVVWARTDDEGVRGFLVPAGTPGFSARDIGRKLSLRASVTSELVLEDCRLPGDAVLPEVRGMRGPLSCLNEARYGIVWGSMGAARACFQAALEYATTRVQFDRPIGGFQLTQQKLADMLVELSKGTLLALHLGRMKDEGRLAPEQVSLGKLNNVREALQIARTARTILGASGITLEYPVIRHMNNLESVLTYEGTSEIHTLVLGKEITGLDAFS